MTIKYTLFWSPWITVKKTIFSRKFIMLMAKLLRTSELTDTQVWYIIVIVSSILSYFCTENINGFTIHLPVSNRVKRCSFSWRHSQAVSLLVLISQSDFISQSHWRFFTKDTWIGTWKPCKILHEKTTHGLLILF